MPDAWGAKRQGDFTTTARKRPVRKKPVFLAGESALVSEFGALCAAAGRPALYKLNSRERPLSPGPRPPQGAPPRAPGLRQAAIPPRGALLAVELTNTDREAKRKNLRALDRALPREALLLSSSTTVTVTAGHTGAPGRLLGPGGALVVAAGALGTRAGPGRPRDQLDRAGAISR